MGIEKTPESLDQNNIDAQLQGVNDMIIETVGISELGHELSAKEAYVCTSLIEAACNTEPKAKKTLSNAS